MHSYRCATPHTMIDRKWRLLAAVFLTCRSLGHAFTVGSTTTKTYRCNDVHRRHATAAAVRSGQLRLHWGSSTQRRSARIIIPTSSSTSTSTTLFGMFDRKDELFGADRIKACVPYLLPLIDGDPFGAYIYERIPPLGLLDDLTIGPLSNMARHIPFSTVILFVALTLGTRFNLDMDRNVRFSAQQAALIDVALIFPELIASSFQDETLPRALVEPLSTFVWYTYMSTVVYSVYRNLRGRRPDQIPYISAFADEMVGPI